MLHHHQTLLSSSSSSESFPFFHLPYSPSSQVRKERRLMEFSLASSASCVNDYDDDSVSLPAENNDVVSIDEYLADEYFLDIEADDNEDETHQQEREKEGEGKENMGFGEGENPLNSPSVLSFEAPALSELSLPTHEVEELEWVSMITDDSLSEIPKIYENHNIPPKIKVDDEVNNQSQPHPPLFAPTKAKRSKRACNLSASWSSSSCSSPSSTTTTTSSASSSFSFPQLIVNHRLFEETPHPVSKPSPPPPPPSKKRGRKPKTAAGGSQTEMRKLFTHGERRCSHCGVNKTPQWRAGPHGAKTLCNACGVRFKSGRLLPEYRPACSPTFVSHVHSNSHRRVLEMRRKKEEREGDKLLFVCSAPPVASF